MAGRLKFTLYHDSHFVAKHEMLRTMHTAIMTVSRKNESEIIRILLHNDTSSSLMAVDRMSQYLANVNRRSLTRLLILL